MNLYKEENPTTVGSYKPSEHWDKWTQFAVMDDKTGGLLACCGYFQNLEKPFEWGLEDYKHAAECIEQAQLYANSVKMFALLERCANSDMLHGTQIQKEAKNLINQITDISEPVKRLLGDDAMRVINHVSGNSNLINS